jgi:membrane protein DedA with SNARE-associated domain
VARVDRSGRWFTWPAVVLSPFLPIPNALVYAVAGWTGMSWVTFLVLDAIGSLAWAGMLAGLGWALGQHAVSVAQEISKYGLWVSIVIVVLVVASQMRRARGAR